MKTKLAKARNRTITAAARTQPRIGARTIPGKTRASDTGPAKLRIKSILVPIDYSAPSKKALDYAVSFAEQFGAKLTLLHVVEPIATPDFANSFPLVMQNDKVMTVCKTQLASLVAQKTIDPKLVKKMLVRLGRSFHEIVDAARMLKTDLIIISTHGYTGLKHALLGSTTERVVRHAPCPVLVVREREHEFLVR